MKKIQTKKSTHRYFQRGTQKKRNFPFYNVKDKLMFISLSFLGKSLIFPLREIGRTNRMEYVKLEKTIRDVVYEAQMRILVKSEEIKVD